MAKVPLTAEGRSRKWKVRKDIIMKLDVVLPLYHPHDGWDRHILEAVRGLRSHFAGQDAELHFYITHDGSPLTCYPEEKLRAISDAAGGNFHFLPYEKNHGKGYSLRYMISRTDGDFIVYTDGDFPFGWESAAQAFELLRNGADVVMGKRGTDYRTALSPLRKILSRGTRFLNRLLMGLPSDYLDTQAGLKGFGRAGKALFLKTETDTFVFDTEFILLAWKNKLKIEPLPIRIRPGLMLSSMSFKVMLRELLLFLRILWKIRILRKY